VAICTPPLQPVTLVDPTIISDCSNPAQLQAALATGGHIKFNCGPNPVTITVAAPLTTSATQDIVLDGGGLVTLNGANTSRILVKPFTPGSDTNKSQGNDLTLQNLRFINGRAPATTQPQDGNARGGAIWVTSPGTKLHIINSTFENNRTTSLSDEDNQGGAVFAANIYETIIVGSVFDNNEAGNGGAFGAIATGLTVYNSRFTNNKASDNTSGGIVRGHGGAIHLDGVSNSFNPITSNTVDICGSVFENNTAVRGGGAIKTTISDNLGTKATYQRSSFSANGLVGTPSVEGHGGAIYHIEDDFAGGIGEDNLEIRDSTFADNYAYKQGGGAWILVQGRGRIINSTFKGNQASQAGSNRVGQGGGLILSNGVIDVVNSTFTNNFATFQGGAIFAGNSSSVTLTNALFYENRLDPTHTNPVTTQYQGYHTNRSLLNGGNNLQYPRKKLPDFDNDINNLITSPASAINFSDPLLGPLADNGGPNQTMALQISSPAIDAGNPAHCPATDQRGISRPQGSACDIGAYEYVVQLTIFPSLVEVNQGDFTLTVRGAGFTAGSKVVWAGQQLTTTFIDSTTLQTTVSNTLISAPAQVPISVSDSSLPPAQLLVVTSLSETYLPLVLK
jgi:predicted outer membrane repeat protein